MPVPSALPSLFHVLHAPWHSHHSTEIGDLHVSFLKSAICTDLFEDFSWRVMILHPCNLFLHPFWRSFCQLHSWETVRALSNYQQLLHSRSEPFFVFFYRSGGPPTIDYHRILNVLDLITNHIVADIEYSPTNHTKCFRLPNSTPAI